MKSDTAMLNFLPGPVKGALSLLLYTVNTIVLSVPLILFSCLKFIIPVRALVVRIDRILIWIAEYWISINTLNSKLFCRINWHVTGLSNLKQREWYLVICNHQSWVDILALQTILNKKIPMLKFFLKKELIWIPFLGLAWWALDFPFMKRYSKKQIADNPRLAGKDLKSTKKACEKFKHTPVSIMNFVEGTRFKRAKRDAQNSPFEFLLKPKAGGIAFVMEAMGDYLHQIIDVTIIYPGGIPSFWQFISGRVADIIIDFEIHPIKESLTVPEHSPGQTSKGAIFNWLNQVWEKKDDKIKGLKMPET